MTTEERDDAVRELLTVAKGKIVIPEWIVHAVLQDKLPAIAQSVADAVQQIADRTLQKTAQAVSEKSWELGWKAGADAVLRRPITVEVRSPKRVRVQRFVRDSDGAISSVLESSRDIERGAS